MADEVVLVERVGPVAVVTLNRPEAMNALSIGLRRALARAVRELSADPAVRAIVLTGAGDRAFSAGLDLKELGAAEGRVFASAGQDPEANPMAAMLACPKPIVGAVNGVAVTGGLEVALACDILICSDKAQFADTHVKVQVFPGWGLSQRLSRLIGASRAKELSLTGRFIDAATAERWGLVNRVAPHAELRESAIELAQTIAANAPAMVERYKRLIDEGAALPLGEAMAMEAAQSRALNANIQATDIENRREHVRASNRGGAQINDADPAR